MLVHRVRFDCRQFASGSVSKLKVNEFLEVNFFHDRKEENRSLCSPFKDNILCIWFSQTTNKTHANISCIPLLLLCLGFPCHPSSAVCNIHRRHTYRHKQHHLDNCQLSLSCHGTSVGRSRHISYGARYRRLSQQFFYCLVFQW